MKKLTLLCSSICMTALLTACAGTTTMSTSNIKQVKEEKLANGSTTRIGFMKAVPEWKCRQLYRKSDSWAMNKFKGMIKFGGPYQVLQEQAIEYANQNNLSPNYIYLYVPTETEINGFNLTPFNEADVIYYQCKNPPAVNDKFFGK